MLDLVPKSNEFKEENIHLNLAKKEKAREMCEELFDESKKNIKIDDIPFQGWTCTELVMFLLDDLENEVFTIVSLCTK